MNGWVLLWQTLLLVSLVSFGLLVVVVGLRAVGDLRSLFADLRADLEAAQKQAVDQQEPGEPAQD